MDSTRRPPGLPLSRRSARRYSVIALIIIIGIVVVMMFSTHESPVPTRSPSHGGYSKQLRVDDGTDDPNVPMASDPPEEMNDFAFLGVNKHWHGATSSLSSRRDEPPHHYRHQLPLLFSARQGSHFLTAVVMSYPKSSRFHLLEQIIKKVAAWPFVWEVILVWNGDLQAMPQSIAALTKSFPSKPNNMTDAEAAVRLRLSSQTSFLTVLPQLQNRVDNRWRIAKYVDTEAILNMDDDINLYMEGAKCMLDVWRASPSSLIAIDVRSHFMHAKEGGGPFGRFGYVARDRSAGFKQYSIALPRSLLTHRSYYVAYDEAWSSGGTPTNDERKKGVKQIVDELLCDDIAFNFVAANTSIESNVQLPGAHVIYVKAKYTAYAESHSADGMTKIAGMKAMRQKCVNALAHSVGHGEVILRHRPWHVLCDVDG